MYISVRTLPCRKLLNYSVEGLKTRLVKWLPINKTLQNQISLNILSSSCHTSRIQVWISVAFASPQSGTEKKKKNPAGKDNCKYQQSHLPNKRLTGTCPCHGAQTEIPSRWRPRSPTTTLGSFFFQRNIGPAIPKAYKSPFLLQQVCCSNISPRWTWNFNGCWHRQHFQLPIDAGCSKMV